MQTGMPRRCPECAAPWADGRTCTEHFHLLGYWELDHQFYDVHHLMVVSYHLQHPSLYSRRGLADAVDLLLAFVDEDVPPHLMRRKIRGQVDSNVRTYRIRGTADDHGAYDHPVRWTMRVTDVTAAGIERYYDSVSAWASSILTDLRASGNLA